MEKQILEIIKDMQSDMKSMQTDMKDMQTDLKGMQTDMKDMQTDLKGMQTDMKDMQTDMKDMQSDIKELKVGQTELKNDVKVFKDETYDNFKTVNENLVLLTSQTSNAVIEHHEKQLTFIKHKVISLEEQVFNLEKNIN